MPVYHEWTYAFGRYEYISCFWENIDVDKVFKEGYL